MGLNQLVNRIHQVKTLIQNSLVKMKWRILYAAIVGLISILIMLFLSSREMFKNFEYKTLDWRFQRLRSNTQVKNDITIILVGSEYTDRLAREKYAQIVEKFLKVADNQAIGFDLVLYGIGIDNGFSVDSKFISDLDNGKFPDDLRKEFKDKGGIDLLPMVNISAITKGQEWKVTDVLTELTFTIRKDAGELRITGKDIDRINSPLITRSKLARIYFAFAKLRGGENQQSYIDEDDPEYKCMVSALESKTKWTDEMIHPKGKLLPCLEGKIIGPLPDFCNASKGIGHTHTTTEEKDVLRKVPLLIKFKNHVYPCLALQIACDILRVEVDEKNIDVQLGKYIKITTNKKEIIKIPIDKEGFMYIKYYGNWDRFKKDSTFTIEELLDKQNPPDIKSIVLVGAKMEKPVGSQSEKEQRIQLVDAHNTPFGNYPGVGIHATILDNIIHKDFLYPKGKLNFAMLTALSLMVGIVGTSRSPFRSIWLALILAGYFGLSLLYFTANYWVETAIPLVVLPIAILGYIAYDIHRHEFAKAKQTLITWGFGAIIIVIGFFVISMLFRSKESGKDKLAYITTLMALITMIFSTNIFGFKKGEEKKDKGDEKKVEDKK